jgi:hypothetical protein
MKWVPLGLVVFLLIAWPLSVFAEFGIYTPLGRLTVDDGGVAVFRQDRRGSVLNGRGETRL